MWKWSLKSKLKKSICHLGIQVLSTTSLGWQPTMYHKYIRDSPYFKTTKSFHFKSWEHTTTKCSWKMHIAYNKSIPMSHSFNAQHSTLTSIGNKPICHFIMPNIQLSLQCIIIQDIKTYKCNFSFLKQRYLIIEIMT